jgi:hypothetical protein
LLCALGAELFDRARHQAKENGKPYGGVIARTEMTPFQVMAIGRIEAFVKTATDEILCGHLTFMAPEPAASEPSYPTEPPPPPTRSRAARPKSEEALAFPPLAPPSLPSATAVGFLPVVGSVSGSCSVAIRITFTALPITSAGRFWPLGPVGNVDSVSA